MAGSPRANRTPFRSPRTPTAIPTAVPFFNPSPAAVTQPRPTEICSSPSCWAPTKLKPSSARWGRETTASSPLSTAHRQAAPLSFNRAQRHPFGGYAISLFGGDGSEAPTWLAGVVNIDGAGAISGAGSILDVVDGAGQQTGSYTLGASAVSAPDGRGRIQIQLQPNGSTLQPLTLVGYIVDATHIRLIESGDPGNAANYQGVLGGLALGQGAATGQFSRAAVAGSRWVFGAQGNDSQPSLQIAGVLTLNANGSVSGLLNWNDLTGESAQVPQAFSWKLFSRSRRPGDTHPADGRLELLLFDAPLSRGRRQRPADIERYRRQLRWSGFSAAEHTVHGRILQRHLWLERLPVQPQHRRVQPGGTRGRHDHGTRGQRRRGTERLCRCRRRRRGFRRPRQRHRRSRAAYFLRR